MEQIVVKDVVTRFGSSVVHRGLNFTISRGVVAAIIGGSGCGKSTVLKEIIGLQRPTSGQIQLFGKDVWSCSEDERRELRHRFGASVQNGALILCADSQ